MKYIDVDRLREELQKPKTELKVGNYYLDNSEQAVGYENALIDFELLIDSLQQEQPSLPSNLDEAANKANFEKPHSLNAYIAFEEAFIAGAKWMAGQMK